MTSKNIGIIHVDRHADIQEKDMDERMHTTPYFHATNLPNVNPKNLVQIGIGGWQVPRAAVPNMVERETNIYTMDDIEVCLVLMLLIIALVIRVLQECIHPQSLSFSTLVLTRLLKWHSTEHGMDATLST